MHSPISRRRFLGSTGRLAAVLTAAAPLIRRASAASEADKIVLALVGCGGRGGTLIRDFVARGDVEVAALCDPDLGRTAALSRDVEAKQGKAPVCFADFRRALDDKSIHALVVATPDHWHAIPTILGCQSGKDVYVEKPASHNIWEGRKMVEAARRYRRVVQVGLQNRSAPYVRKALEYIQSGKLGKIHLCKVYNLKSGGPFKVPADSKAPEDVDYDAWLGPAPSRPFNGGHFHGGWYYFWAYCGGDMGNDGIHQLDIARWLVGKEFPKAVHSSGGKLAFQDDREVPDTQVVTLEFDDLVMTFENTQWASYMDKIAGDIRQGDLFPYWPQCSTRIEFYGTKGLMLLGRHGGGWQVFASGKQMSRPGVVVAQEYGRIPDAPHKEDFIQSIRTRKLPSGDIEEGHRSAILAHLGNISLRVGSRKLLFDSGAERFVGDDEANRLVKREYRAPYVIPDPV